MLSLSYFIGLPSLSRLLRNSLVVLTRPHFRKSFAIALDSLSVLLRLDVLLRSTALLSPNSSYDHYPRTVQLTARFFRRLVSLHSHLITNAANASSMILVVDQIISSKHTSSMQNRGLHSVNCNQELELNDR